MSFLELKNVCAGYGALKVLNNVSLRVDPGEIVVLIGPNGAGKTTVLKSVFKLVDVYSGKICFQEKDVRALHTHDLIQLGMSLVPQGRQVFGSLTVRENLEMGAYLTQDNDVVQERIASTLLQFPELKPKMKDYAFALSGGQQQMLAMGRALMQDPKLLLLDEPSLGLAPKMMQTVLNRIKKINEQGTSVLMVEQNARQAVKLADRIYVLEDGKVALHGGKDILSRKEIQHIYLGGR